MNAKGAPLTARAAGRPGPPGRAIVFHAGLTAAPLGSKTKIQNKESSAMQKTERKPLFDLGQLVATLGALPVLEKAA
jgi:hypothetical protein